MTGPPIVRLKDIRPRPQYLKAIERQRNKREVHWAAECFAEALGVFLYVYCGIGSGAAFVVSNILKQPGLSSLTQIGFAYAFGVLLALGICGATSGGHFNPCVTVAHIVFNKFPVKKGMRYIFFQILGSYIASLVVYAQYKSFIDLSEEALTAAGMLDAIQYTPNGPAGIFALYLAPGQTLGRVFFTEFVACFVLAILIWACIDPTNALIPPPAAPFVVAFGYCAVIWGFATPGGKLYFALNSARDIGTRLLSITIWGRGAAGGPYAAIAALTNIPATLLGVFLYETFLTDSDRVIPQAHLEMIRILNNHGRLIKESEGSRDAQVESNEKPSIVEMENA
ncbi:putative aquaporin 2 [Infundibulicybe gibba]|nr:putative aquaporin 2 [Infundibulicybe gibba]